MPFHFNTSVIRIVYLYSKTRVGFRIYNEIDETFNENWSNKFIHEL